MEERLLLAGTTGAIGKRLVPLLRDAGYALFGTTRSVAKADDLSAAGVAPVVVDVFDAPALSDAVASIRPALVIHQLTDLPWGLPADRMAAAAVHNARIRDEGTRNLVQAATAAGARRLVAQSIAWAYAPGPEPHTEDDPLDLGAEGSRAISVRGVAALEKWTLESPPLSGTVLRYGQIYGPGTGAAGAAGSAPLHVDAAAHAALLAAGKGISGIFNVAETSGYVSSEKARRDLGWNPDFRLPARR